MVSNTSFSKMFSQAQMQQMKKQMLQEAQRQMSRAPGRLRSKFTEEEDSRLKTIVQQNPHCTWHDVATFFPGKTVRQVRDRYNNYLAPQLNHSAWTAAEDSLLREKFALYGPQWRVLKQFFAGRSDVNIKNRWSVLISQSQRFQFEASQPVSPLETAPVMVPQAAEPVMESEPVHVDSRRTSLDFDVLQSFEFEPFDSFGEFGEFGFGTF
jgi:hypothetical protein